MGVRLLKRRTSSNPRMIVRRRIVREADRRTMLAWEKEMGKAKILESKVGM